MKRLALAAGLLSLALSACDTSATDFNIPETRDLKPGGVYVAYNLGCEKGCDQISKGDLIQKLDGTTVKTSEDLSPLTDGQPHKLDLLADDTLEPKTVEVVATPKDNMPPLEDIPPFWTVSAEKLNEAPDWARKRMFGHASPMVMLVNSNGGIVDGRQLYGKKRFIVYWDWGDRTEQAAAVDFMQVLQKAQADLNAQGVEIMFTHVRFPTGRQAPMNDSDLRDWQKRNGVEGLPNVPMYRFPNETEFNDARQLGMENAFTVFENLGKSPTILLLDEKGIVRWHSEGIQQPMNSEIKDPEQYTVIKAVEFARDKL